MTPTWDETVKFARDAIEAARDLLEQPGTSEKDADTARGRIAALRELIALPETKAQRAPDKIVQTDTVSLSGGPENYV